MVVTQNAAKLQIAHVKPDRMFLSVATEGRLASVPAVFVLVAARSIVSQNRSSSFLCP